VFTASDHEAILLTVGGPPCQSRRPGQKKPTAKTCGLKTDLCQCTGGIDCLWVGLCRRSSEQVGS